MRRAAFRFSSRSSVQHWTIAPKPSAGGFRIEGEGQAMIDKPKRGQWSFAEQRQLVELAAASMSLETIVHRLRRPAESVARMAKQLGVTVKSVKTAK
jgi:hypothetical protein